jgi:hypothetical protein
VKTAEIDRKRPGIDAVLFELTEKSRAFYTFFHPRGVRFVMQPERDLSARPDACPHDPSKEGR